MNAEDAPGAHVGQIIADKYRLLNLLGAGGMGAVYEAEHLFTKRRVALKRMYKASAKSRLAAERFLRESQAPSSIGHPGIVQVLDGGSDRDGSLYLVLELLEGVSVREALDQNALQAEQVVRIGIELLGALASAHDKGFVHRDIKPDNVFLAEDGRGGVTVKLLDFGVASVRDSEADVKLTQTGAVLGTPLYMSPEQAAGRRVDARSDLWSLGALLYRALSGRSPFEGQSYNALIVAIVTHDHLPLSERRGELPAALYQVVERALQKRPEDRYQSAREMLDALRAVDFHARPTLRGAARAAPPLPKRTPTRERPRWGAWAIAGSALVAASFALLRQTAGEALQRAAHRPPSAADEAPPAERSAAAPLPASGLSVEQVTTVLSALQPQMQTCLQNTVLAGLQSDAPSSGALQLAIELHITPEGHADFVRTAGTVPPELERCVRARLAEAVFPAAPAATEFHYPLIFQATVIGK